MSTIEPYRYSAGSFPVILSQPHTATYVPPALLSRMTDEAKTLSDTDWHIDRLYGFASKLGVHVLTPTHSRYVVDLNRAPDGASLYPGKFTTGLVPITLFDGTPIYQKGAEPDAVEISDRLERYWKPYHYKLESLIIELKQKHGYAIVFDAHSIRSEVPMLFDGTLPDLNFGTADGATADDALVQKLLTVAKQSSYSTVYNGRFKGGYITRHYGRPKAGVQAIQLELAQKNYMQEVSPFSYDETKAGRLQAVLSDILSILVK